MIRLMVYGILLGNLVRAGAVPAGADPWRGVDETRSLETLFALTDERAALNREVLRWFVAGPGEGLYPADYLAQAGRVGERAEAFAPPPSLRTVHAYVLQAMQLQATFIAEWFDAHQRGAPFASQLTDEYAYHEGLHRSHRVLLKAYAELAALFPRASEARQRSFQAHLRAMDFQ